MVEDNHLELVIVMRVLQKKAHLALRSEKHKSTFISNNCTKTFSARKYQDYKHHSGSSRKMSVTTEYIKAYRFHSVIIYKF